MMDLQSERNLALILLGKKFVSQLALDDSVDTLGRWMAHHLAELISNLEKASPDSRYEKEAEIRAAILDLWAHRYSLPNKTRPFADFVPILRALESLDPEVSESRFMMKYQLPDSDGDESVETKNWLQMARSLDSGARKLINFCIQQAAAGSLNSAAEWVQAAVNADVDDVLEVRIIQFYTEADRFLKTLGEDSGANKIIEERIAALDTYVEAANIMREHLSAALLKKDATK